MNRWLAALIAQAIGSASGATITLPAVSFPGLVCYATSADCHAVSLWVQQCGELRVAICGPDKIFFDNFEVRK
jgi:C4-dicarboxylate transporter